MNRKILRILSLVFFLVWIAAPFAQAEIGRILTKRERMKNQGYVSAPSSDMLYQKIHESFLREDYSGVDRLAEDYLRDSRAESNREDVLYLQALSLFKLNRGSQAREKLASLENAYGTADHKASASASIGDSYFYEGDFPKAYESYQETLRKYPDSDQSAYLSQRLSEIDIKLQKPTSPLRQMALEEHSFFTVQVGSFSKQKNAEALTNKLRYYQYDAYLDRDETGRMYRVRVGKLASKEEALTLESRLRKEGYPTKIYP